MTFSNTAQHGGFQNPVQQNPMQWGSINPQTSQMYDQRIPAFGQQQSLGLAPLDAVSALGLAAYGPQYQPNVGTFGQTMWGQGGGSPQPYGAMQSGWGQPRQLTQQDVGEVVRQLMPLLPHIVAQAQQPLAAFGYGGFGYGPYQQRQLSQQDINEVVRQILPILPQIVGALQGQAPLPIAAVQGGFGQGFTGQGPIGPAFIGQNPYAQQHNPYAQQFMGQPFGLQQPFGQTGWPAFQAAFGNLPNSGPIQGQRQLTPQDVNEVVRQLVATIPQVISNLQAHGQQRTV